MTVAAPLQYTVTGAPLLNGEDGGRFVGSTPQHGQQRSLILHMDNNPGQGANKRTSQTFAQDASGELEQENIKVRFLSIFRNKLSVDSCGNICRYVKSADDKQSKDEGTFKKLFNRCISCLNIIHDY